MECQSEVQSAKKTGKCSKFQKKLKACQKSKDKLCVPVENNLKATQDELKEATADLEQAQEELKTMKENENKTEFPWWYSARWSLRRASEAL